MKRMRLLKPISDEIIGTVFAVPIIFGEIFKKSIDNVNVEIYNNINSIKAQKSHRKLGGF